MHRFHSATLSISLLALALAGCNKSGQDLTAASASPSPASLDPNSGLPPLPAALPMQPGPASPLIAAPPVAALPVRRYVNVARPARDRDAYAYLDRASDVQDEIGDAPPDYGYRNNDGVSPWVWQTNGGDRRYAEPSSDGYRYYYYQPGAREPYLVRTRNYSYAYAAGALVAIYTLSGALLPHDHYDNYRDEASRYYSRGEALRQYSDERPHEGVIASDWSERRHEFSHERANWEAARQRQPNWRDYHAQNDPSRQPGWQQEYQQRQQVAQQFSGWQSRGLTGSPPPALAGTGSARPDGHRQDIPGPQRSGGFDGHRHDFTGPQGGAPVAGPVQDQAAQTAAAQRQAEIARQQQIAAQNQAQQQYLAGQRAQQEADRTRQQAAAQQQAAAAREQHLAAQNQAQQQLLASRKAEQEANRARQQAAAQQQAVAAREQHLAAQNQAQQQLLANRQAEQEANRARQQTAAQQEQMIANVHRQQEHAAQQQASARQQAQHEALAAERQAQLHVLAAQRQTEVAQVRAPAQAPAPAPAGHREPNHPRADQENDRQHQ